MVSWIEERGARWCQQLGDAWYNGCKGKGGIRPGDFIRSGGSGWVVVIVRHGAGDIHEFSNGMSAPSKSVNTRGLEIVGYGGGRQRVYSRR